MLTSLRAESVVRSGDALEVAPRRSRLLAVLVAGCTGSGDATAGGPSPTPTPSTSSPSAAVPALVGEWQRLQRCSELVGLLRKADMPAAVPEMLAEDGWVPGVDDPGQIDTRHPCRGAVARLHCHFFTSDGQFGSRDATGEQVDDGRYRLVGDDRFIIGAGDRNDVTFHYTVTGDTFAAHPGDPCLPTGLLPGRVERRGGLRPLHLAPDPVIVRGFGTPALPVPLTIMVRPVVSVEVRSGEGVAPR